MIKVVLKKIEQNALLVNPVKIQLSRNTHILIHTLTHLITA